MKPKLCTIRKWIGQKLAELPLTLAALDSKELGYSKVREFVNLATPQTEAEWIEYAKKHSSRQIEARVSKKQQADGTEKTAFNSKVTAEQRQAIRKSREMLSKHLGRRVAPSEVVGEMATAIANGLFEKAAKGEARPKPRNYVSFQPCPVCLDTFVPTPEGLMLTSAGAWLQAIEDGAEVVDATPEFFCDCKGEKHRRDRCPNWSLREAKKASKHRYTPVEWKKLIEARDGFICRNPACRNELPLHGSHLKPHRHGAPPTPENMRMHCGGCNTFIEEEKIRILGIAPFERYYTAGGDFLGYGYDPEPRSEELPPDRKSSHVGNGSNGRENTPPGRRRGQTGPKNPN